MAHGHIHSFRHEDWYYLLALVIPGDNQSSKKEVTCSNRLLVMNVSIVATIRIAYNLKAFIFFLTVC